MFLSNRKKGEFIFFKEDLPYRRLSEDAKCNLTCLVLPTVCRLTVMKIAHEMGHFAAKNTWQPLKKLFFWPNIRKDTIRFCVSCTDCQKQRRITVWDRVPIQAVERPDVAFDTISIDCAGPIVPPSASGHNFILVILDHCTRWCDCIPLKTLTAKEACNALNTVF